MLASRVRKNAAYSLFSIFLTAFSFSCASPEIEAKEVASLADENQPNAEQATNPSSDSPDGNVPDAGGSSSDSGNNSGNNSTPGDNDNGNNPGNGDDSSGDNSGANSNGGDTTPGGETDSQNDDSSPGEESQPVSDTADEQPVENFEGDCDRNGFDGVRHSARKTQSVLRYIAQTSVGYPHDRLILTSFQDGFGGPTSPGSYSLEGSNYSDCGLCLLALANCTDGENCEKVFYADEGSVEITSIGESGQVLAASLLGVKFREVTIAEETYVSTPVVEGDQWCISDYSFSVVIGAGATDVLGPDAGGTTTGGTSEETGDDGAGTNPDTNTDSDNGGTNGAEIGEGVAILGGGTHSAANLNVSVFATASHGLVTPKDIEFNPAKTDEFWVVNQGDSSVSILLGASGEMGWICDDRYYGAGDGCDCGCGIQDPDCPTNTAAACQYGCGSGQEVNPVDPTSCVIAGMAPSGESASTRFIKRKNSDGSGTHFLARPAGIAFGTGERMATVQEEDRVTQPSTPWEFMGPTLWTTNIKEFEGGHPSHYDMLHNSPNGAGIAWESGNAYWIFDGYHGSLTRYDFNEDHGPGGTDHSDGVVYRFVDGEMRYVSGVVSHLAFDSSTGLLYAADTGNNRIVALDVNSGQLGGAITPNFDGTVQRYVNGAALTTVVQGSAVGLVRPAGLELVGDILFVSDNEQGRVYAFSKQGELLDWLDLGLPSGALNGLTFDSRGRMYVTNTSSNQILRVSVD